MYDGPKLSLYPKKERAWVFVGLTSSFVPLSTPSWHLSVPVCLYGYVCKLGNHFVSSKDYTPNG